MAMRIGLNMNPSKPLSQVKWSEKATCPPEAHGIKISLGEIQSSILWSAKLNFAVKFLSGLLSFFERLRFVYKT
jgi:hypothetical protein